MKGLFARPPARPSDSVLLRVRDTLSWNLSHPACREDVHAWRLRQRGRSLTGWRLQRLQALLKGVAPGRPPWLRDGADNNG